MYNLHFLAFGNLSINVKTIGSWRPNLSVPEIATWLYLLLIYFTLLLIIFQQSPGESLMIGFNKSSEDVTLKNGFLSPLIISH